MRTPILCSPVEACFHVTDKSGASVFPLMKILPLNFQNPVIMYIGTRTDCIQIMYYKTPESFKSTMQSLGKTLSFISKSCYTIQGVSKSYKRLIDHRTKRFYSIINFAFDLSREHTNLDFETRFAQISKFQKTSISKVSS